MVIEQESFACSKLGPVFGMHGDKLSRYYLTITSDFAKESHKADNMFKNISENGIVLEGDIGKRLSIDEVNLRGQVYTILSNVDKAKGIIAILPGTKSKPIIETLKNELGERIDNVEEVACDMGPSMEAIVESVFPKAKHVTDRFHVMKEILSDLHAIRMRIKTKIKAKQNGEKIKAKKNGTKYNAPRTNLGETEYETLQMLRYQCNKRMNDWSNREKQRFYGIQKDESYKELIVGIECVQDLFSVFDSCHDVCEGEKKMKKWVEKYENHSYKGTEIKNMISTIQLHHTGIMNYFISRHSTGYSEGLHSRIRELLQTVRGFKNKDFMIYRILKLFSTIQH